MNSLKYILIVILSFGVYFINKSYESQLEKSKKLQKHIIFLKNKLNINSKKIEILNNKLKNSKKIIKNLKSEKEKLTLKQKKQKKQKIQNMNNNKTITIVLPNTKIDYSKIIPDVNYTNINLFNSNNTTRIIDDKIKVLPNITFDKDKKINSIKVNIQTKF